MSNPVAIRRGDRRDLAAVVALVSQYCAADGHDFNPDTAAAGVAPLLADDRYGLVMVAIDGGAASDEVLVGYGIAAFGWSVECGGREAVLDELYVRDRGRGVGTALVAAIERECRSAGVIRMFLETEAPNESARRLYRRLGYHDESSIWMSKLL